MGASERKQQEKEIRRNDIIDAAERVFFAKGYELATMDDVAREAEFSKRTVYVYFTGKEEIYFEIMLRGYRLLNGMLDEELLRNPEAPALDKIRQLGLLLHRFSDLFPDYFASIMEYENRESDFDRNLPDKLKAECYEQGERMFRYLTDALARGVEGGEIRKGLDVGRTALILWSCALGVFNTARKKAQYLRHYHQMEPEALIADAFELLLRTLQSRPETERPI